MADLGIISTHGTRGRGGAGESIRSSRVNLWRGREGGPRVKPAENWHMRDWSGKETC